MIPLTKPSFGVSEGYTVKDVLKSGMVEGDGKYTKLFEKALAKYLEAKHAFFLNSCTAALHLAMEILNIKNKEVIVPAYTFTSTALAPLLTNNKVVLADVDLKTANIDPKDFYKKITSKTRAVIPVHYAGVPYDVENINNITSAHNNIITIEDAAQALGSKYKGKKAGNLGDIGCISFHGTKNITCGEGGAIVVNDDNYAEKILEMRDKGTDKHNFKSSRHKYPDFYKYKSIGWSYVQSEINAAIIYEQFKKLDKINRKRKEIAKYYIDNLKHLDKIELPEYRKDINWHLFTIRVKRRDFFIKEMNNLGVSANIHYIPMYHHPLYKDNKKQYPNTENVYNTLVRLPLYHSMNRMEINKVIDSVEEVHVKL